MNRGLEILLKRVESNPEEFNEWGGRWTALLEGYKNILPADEMKILKDKINEKYCREFSEKVIQELLNPKSENPNPMSGMRSGGLTQAQSMYPYQQASMQQAQTNMKLQQLQQAKNSQGFLGSLGDLFK